MRHAEAPREGGAKGRGAGAGCSKDVDAGHTGLSIQIRAACDMAVSSSFQSANAEVLSVAVFGRRVGLCVRVGPVHQFCA